MRKLLPWLVALAFGSTLTWAQPVITQQPTNQVAPYGGTAVFGVEVSGPGPFTYQWQFNGNNCDFVTTVAGIGTNAYSGDGGLAINAALNSSAGVAVDNAGNLFISDSSNNRIRKVDTNGLITTVASIPSPYGLTVDYAGNLFISRPSSSILIKVDANGIVTTVAGSGGYGYWGDGGLATSAGLWSSYGVAVDNAGNLFIADAGNNRIRKVDTNGIIKTVVGDGLPYSFGDGGPATNAAVNYPCGVMVDSAGNLFIADQNNQRIRKVDTNGIITTVAGTGTAGYSGDGGAATDANLKNPSGMTVDGAGNLFIADSSNNRIRKVDTNGLISTVAGSGVAGFSGFSGPATNMMLGFPSGVTIDNAGSLLIADRNNSRICKLITAMVSSLKTTTLTLNKVSTNSLGNYSVIISNSSGSVTSSVAALNMPAYITSQPKNLTVIAGDSATFGVTADSTGPFSYQWALNGTNIDWATNNPLILTNVQPNQAGAYSVAVSNTFGGITSSNAALTVLPLLVANQPQSQSTALGATVSFSVTPSGQGPFFYQWQFQSTNLDQATNSSLVLTNAQLSQAGNYSVVVSNIFGTVTSSNAILTVYHGIIIWGNNSYGQFSVPESATNVIAMAAGDYHLLALRTDGTVVAWGTNEFDSGETNVPPGLSNVVSIAAGSTHSLALKRDGTVIMWGQIIPRSGISNAPPQATNVAALALGPGAQHALILKTDGTVLDWNKFYPGLTTNIPPTVRNIVGVASGASHALALRSDGKVVAWGNVPAAVPASATNIVAIAAGWYGNAALRADGTVLVWGSIRSPTSDFTNVVDLACPFNESSSGSILALRRDGSLIEYTTALPNYPTNYISAIASGSYNGLALVASGPPVFPGLPINRCVASGSRAYFHMNAVGAFPMFYQWSCNGTNIPGATNTILALNNVQPIQAGNYYTLIASNSFGMATNGAMTLTVVPLEFSIQPVTLSTPVGTTAKFSIAYTNGAGPFTFQWQSNGISIDGATNSFLSLTNVQLSQAGTYSAIVGNLYGTVTNSAVLTVQPFAFDTGLTNLLFATNGFQLQLNGIFATNSVILYASTDLVSWLPILTNSPATGSVQFMDASATNWPVRFYRSSEQ